MLQTPHQSLSSLDENCKRKWSQQGLLSADLVPPSPTPYHPHQLPPPSRTPSPALLSQDHGHWYWYKMIALNDAGWKVCKECPMLNFFVIQDGQTDKQAWLHRSINYAMWIKKKCQRRTHTHTYTHTNTHTHTQHQTQEKFLVERLERNRGKIKTFYVKRI